MTTIVYNGVILRDCETKSFNQSIELDQSGTDVLFSRFTIRVASTLVATSSPLKSFGIEPGGGSTVTQRAKEVYRLLSEPRKDFYMLIDNSVNHEKSPTATFNESLLTATGDLTSNDGEMPIYPPIGNGFVIGNAIPRSSVIDVNNGPHPKVVSITEIIAGRSMRVEFEIEVCRKICFGIPTGQDIKPDEDIWGEITVESPNVLSNRWQLSESKDENWVTTRTIEGTLRVVHTSFWPHLMRAICVPPLLKGYKRVRQAFVDDPTGLTLKYTIEDRQAHAAPPYPAIAWSGHHAETATGPNGSILGGEFSIKLTGPPGVDKVQLIGAAGKVAVDRIAGLVPNFTSGERQSYQTQINNAAIVNILHEPTIEMRVQVRYIGEAVADNAFGMRVKDMGKPIDALRQYTGGEAAAWSAGGNYDRFYYVKFAERTYVCVEPHVASGSFQTDFEKGRWGLVTNKEPVYGVTDYDPLIWPVPLAYDSPTPAGIFACYLQNPCSVWHAMPQGKPPESTGSDEGDEEAANRSLNTPSGKPDYHPSTIFHAPHVLPPDQNYYKSPNDEQLINFPYVFVDLESEYQINNGWTQLPLADTTANAARTCSLIKLHGSTAKRIMTVTATRDGKPPTIPSFVEKMTDPNGIKEALADTIVKAKAPQLGAAGQNRRYSVEVVYVYLLERAPRPNELLRIGSTQLDRIGPASNRINLSEVTTGGNEIQDPGALW